MVAENMSPKSPAEQAELDKGFLPGGRKRLIAAVVTLAVALFGFLFLLPIFMFISLFSRIFDGETYHYPEGVFWQQDKPYLWLIGSEMTGLDDESDPVYDFFALNLETGEKRERKWLTEEEPLETIDKSEASYLVEDGLLYVIGYERAVHVLLPDDLYPLSVCSGNKLGWVLARDSAGQLFVTRFDGEEFTTPVALTNEDTSGNPGSGKHEAALLPAPDGWVLLSGTESGAKYKFLPHDAMDAWASIPFKPAPFRQSSWTAFTHKGNARVLAMPIGDFVNPFTLLFSMLADFSVDMDLYSFQNGDWRKLTTIDVPFAGDLMAAIDDTGKPALIWIAAFNPLKGEDYYRYDPAAASRRPWVEGDWDVKNLMAEWISDFMPAMMLGYLAWLIFFALAVIALSWMIRRYRIGQLRSIDGQVKSYASLLRRGVARVIDLFLIMLPAYGTALIFMPIWGSGQQDDVDEKVALTMVIILLLLVMIYIFPLFFWAILEAVTGQTPGKWFMRIKVVDLQTFETPKFGKAFLRNLLLIVDMISYGLAAMGVIALSRYQQRVGDMGGKTVVVDVRAEIEKTGN